MDVQWLTRREKQILTVRAQIAAHQNNYPPTPAQIAEVLGLSAKNVYQVMRRLMKKGLLMRGEKGIEATPSAVKELLPAQRLEGTAPGRLILHIELTGHRKSVLNEVHKAIERLTWFAQQLQTGA